ncbi:MULTISPECIES: efflux RND transporter periplasmic adaptor subunit [Crocosphaera]|uniref:Efflux transporter, RND family, MFP subunit n=4 Tax=Crocosphaera TaxID=263510 RepID=G5JBN6_CROWT|nr:MULTISPECIES: efflux RND transporter periplasmic adaptor subunit [Crocosphaera]EHJ10377.1 efflux transporter, RND family, MFP subunit [Crocosphaera watsonii WH 0003]MCH2247256.1 efflux RND transporter periplasmic adaptor subunit [Crocosphaera sp.]CCQ56604.1 efflux transporter, RND family, MFP subunit [Crocosphaera watsonii WH 0005]
METVAKQKFNTGLKWIASSTMLVVISTGGWLSYDSMRNRSLEPLTVQSFTVKKDTVENLINESGIVELASQQTLKSPVTGGGIVERVLVQVGDRVKSGQILVMLRNPEQQTALAQQQLEIQKQELQLERNREKIIEASRKLQVARQEIEGLSVKEIEIQKQELQLKRNREKVIEQTKKLNAAQEELQELETLLEKGFIPDNEFQQQKDRVLIAESQLRDAELAVQLATLEFQSLENQRQSKQRELSKQVLIAQAQFQDAQSEVSTNTRELKRLTLEKQKFEQKIQNNFVRASFTGKVLDVNIKAGDVVRLGEPLLTLGDTSQELVTLELFPLDANQVKVNHPVRISLISPQAKSFTGRVQSISKVATSLNKNSSNATVTATVELDKPSKVLIPGSRVDAEIVLAARKNVVVLSRDLIQGSKSDAFVWVRDSQGKAQKRPISLGLEGLIKVEVTNGLEPGEEVIVPSADSPLKPGIPVNYPN